MSETSFGVLHRRAIVAYAPRVPSAADLNDWAEICDHAGFASAATMLTRVAALRQGHAPGARVRREAPLDPLGGCAGVAARSEGTVAIAVNELEAFSRDWSARLATLVGNEREGSSSTRACLFVGPPEDIAQAVAKLHAAMAANEPHDLSIADAVIAQFADASGRLPQYDYRPLACAPLPTLAAGLTFAAMQAWLIEDGDLLLPPFGSAALWHRVVRFSISGLGPGFGNVARIVRRSRDLFELADRGCRAGGRALALEAWLGLLARRLTGSLLDEVVDDCGDRDLRQALTIIFEHHAAQAEQAGSLPLFRRFRDIGLDNRDYGFALRAQSRVLEETGQDRAGRIILGSIAATAGQNGLAEQIFTACLEGDAGDADVRARLEAMRAHRFDVYAVRHGYDSPPDRQRYRLRRSERAPQREQAVRRPTAVELSPDGGRGRTS